MVRGRVGEYPIGGVRVEASLAVGRVLQTKGFNKVVASDTRISGYMFESALEAGCRRRGSLSVRCPRLIWTHLPPAQASWSVPHNPYHDNGIRFFRDGQKLPDAVEEIEELLAQPLETAEPDALGKAERIVDAAGRYIEFCKSTIPPIPV